MKQLSSRTVAIIALAILAGVGVIVLIVLTTIPGPASPQNTPSSPVRTNQVPANTAAPTPTSSVSNPIYVSLLTHIEEPDANHADYTKDEAAFNQLRAAYVDLATMLHDEGTTFNFESDWNFLLADLQFDHGDETTNGKNLIKWMHDDLGFSIDPHAHETDYNYADVSSLISQLGVTPSNVVGGYIAYPPSDSKLEYLWSPIHGNHYDYTWTPGILWGGGTFKHIQDDLVDATGVWRPKDAENFLTDDPNAPLPNVGAFGSGWPGLADLLKLQTSGQLEEGKIYTMAIMAAPFDIITAGYIDGLKKTIESYRSDVAAGRIKWATPQTVITDWKSVYGSQPNLLLKTDAQALVGTGGGGPGGSIRPPFVPK